MSEASGVGPGPRGDDTMWDVPSQVLRRRAPGPVDMDGTVIGMVDQRPPPPAPLPRAVANRVKTGSGAVAAARLGVSTGRATPARKRPSRNEIFGYIAVGLCVAGAFGVGGTAAWMRSASRGAQHNAVAAQAESADGVSLIATALPGNGVGVAPPSAGPAPPPDFSPASAIPGAAAALPPLAGPVPLAQPADAQPIPSGAGPVPVVVPAGVDAVGVTETHLPGSGSGMPSADPGPFQTGAALPDDIVPLLSDDTGVEMAFGTGAGAEPAATRPEVHPVAVAVADQPGFCPVPALPGGESGTRPSIRAKQHPHVR